ncbi:MAG: tetratricopeptide repeat protein, partial [Candidatus Omnitrophica bacterium]|nr:tetratricopeptide repeat protein [Candidatus Omnitrophota bacterium]
LLNRLANSYKSKSDYVKAAEIYKKMTELKPENIGNFQMLSNAYKNAGQNDKAVMVWEDLTRDSNDAKVFMQAATFYKEGNDIEKAIAAMKKAIELEPDNVSYLQAIEGLYISTNKFDEAELVCNKVLTCAKASWQKEWANSELIKIYQKQNKLADLIVKFEKDLEQSPKEITIYKSLVDLYKGNAELDKAAGAYERAIAQGLNDRDTNNKLLDLYERSNKLDKAEIQLKKIIGMAPQENALYERLANLLFKAGKKEDAKRVWNELLAKVGNDARMFSRYGDKLNEWGDVNGAVAQNRKAQALDVKNLSYTIRIADILAGKGDFNAAKKELNDVIAKTTDTRIKQEVERKIKDIEAKLNAPKAALAKPVVAKELKQKPSEKKGFFSIFDAPKTVPVKSAAAVEQKQKLPENKKGFFSIFDVPKQAPAKPTAVAEQKQKSTEKKKGFFSIE